MISKASRKTKALSGAKAQAYFRGLFETAADLSKEGRETLLETCAAEIAQVRVRLSAPDRGSKPEKRVKRRQTPEIGTTTSAVASATGEPTFDPFAFSLVVVMTKDGREGLSARLNQITDVENLRALARAQHVPVPAEAADQAGIVAAILDGTAQRIADRRAAAS